MPFGAVWPDEQEADLKWDEHVMAIFFGPQYGNDMGMLQTQSKAPTMLHSWAHLLRACPRGCRTLPTFTEETSAERGTWIWNFLSKDFNQVRRCPSTTSFWAPQDPRSACLVKSQHQFRCYGSCHNLCDISRSTVVSTLTSMLPAKPTTSTIVQLEMLNISMVQAYRVTNLIPMDLGTHRSGRT